jgi:opacity protein-like surface antigen
MNTFHRIMIALSLPLLFCGQVRGAQHSGPYVGAFLGGNMLTGAKSTDDQGSFNLMFNPALQGSVVLGWDLEQKNPLGEGRVELEYSRRSNPLDKAEFVEGKFKGSGDLTVDSLLLNCIGVYRSESRLSPYGGVGIGAARIDASGLKVTGQPLTSGTATVFAYQLQTGVDHALTKSLSLDLGYRFFSSTRPRFTEASGHKFETDYFSHSIVLGLRYGF